MTVILVDGDSKDKTVQIASNILSKSNINFKIYSDQGLGLGAARQIVIDKAYSDYVIFVDADIILKRDFVRKQVEFMERNPDVGVAIGRYLYMDGPFIASLHNLAESTMYRNDVTTQATIFRLEAVKQIGGFDKRIKGACEDIDIIRRIQLKGWKFLVNDKAEFYHNCRESLKGLWLENIWYGKGGYYFTKKIRQKINWRQIPIIAFIGGIKIALKAYKMMGKKRSFFLPFLLLFENLAWWFGFIKAYLNE